MFLLIELHVPTAHHSVKAGGDSHIRHGARWLSLYQDQTLRAKIAVRNAYPGTYCQRMADGSVTMGYGQGKHRLEDEFLRILFGTDGSLTIQRDLYCTLPIYYGYDGTTLVVSNEYREVVTRLSRLTLSTQALKNNLLAITPAQPYTLWEEIHILGERQTLWFKEGALLLVPPAPRSWTYGVELARTDPRHFPTILQDRLQYFIDTRLRHNKVGFELSGGLDSSLLPLFLAARGYTQPMPAATCIQLEPAQRVRQQQKIDILEAATMARSHRIMMDAQRHFPLAPMLQSGTLYPTDPMSEPYEAAMTEVTSFFQSQGVTVAVTGCGGDQLLEHHPHPSIAKPRTDDGKTSFLTEKCTVADREGPVSAPIPTLLSNSVILESLTLANRYISYGIWPVSPFNDIQLFNFCQALPIQFRANKNIFRAYFEANQFPDILYRGANEDYAYLFNTSMRSGIYDKLFEHLLKHSVTERLGYIDAARIKAQYAALRAVGLSDSESFGIYTWMEAEINLQVTPHVASVI